jgi:2-polyprenyl-6-hydroxyphenyl methylase/3-demethylubiquinone-9 3-methyltransferase
MPGYYKEKLSGQRLKQCYDIAPPRVRRYLDAEVETVLQQIAVGDRVLELGCGTGRILPQLAAKAGLVVGIDNCRDSLLLAQKSLHQITNCFFGEMDATLMGFGHQVFDVVACIQNGISAFQVNPRLLIIEALRVTRTGGSVLFSTYSPRFWGPRLEWFELQAKAGLLGEIDWDRTGSGEIVCKDGFRATTLSEDQFLSLTKGLHADTHLQEVDNSSLFCHLTPLPPH